MTTSMMCLECFPRFSSNHNGIKTWSMLEGNVVQTAITVTHHLVQYVSRFPKFPAETARVICLHLDLPSQLPVPRNKLLRAIFNVVFPPPCAVPSLHTPSIFPQSLIIYEMFEMAKGQELTRDKNLTNEERVSKFR